MTTYFFPDNTVLINFTILARHDTLEWFVRGQGLWTVSVARECRKSAGTEGLEGMARWSSVFGAPLAPTTAELVDAQVIADRMRKPGENSPAQHMGEAESIAVIVRRQMTAVFLTDDHDAARAARAEPLIDVASTTRILALAAVAGRLAHAEARQCLAELLERDRVLGNPPRVADFDTYVTARRASRGH